MRSRRTYVFFYLGLTDLAAQVGLATLAELALAALGGVQGDDVVADLDASDTLADGLDDSTTLVAKDDGEDTFGVCSFICIEFV